MSQGDSNDIGDVWAGQLELILKEDAEEYSRGFRGAYTTVLVRCRDVKEYLDAVADHVGREGFVVGGISRLFPLASGEIELSESITDLAARTREYPVQWTTFHMFKGDG